MQRLYFNYQTESVLIKIDKCLLVLTVSELIDAIKNDDAILEKAIKQGKGEMRIIQNLKRSNKSEELKVYKRII